MKVKSESEVAQSCPTVLDPMDCSLPGSPVHGIFRARVLEWGASAFSEADIRYSFSDPFEKVLFYIGVKLIYSVILVSSVEQSDSNYQEGATLSEPTHVSIHTYSFFRPNKHFTYYFPSRCGISLPHSDRPGTCPWPLFLVV